MSCILVVMTLGQFHLMRVMLRDPHHAPAASLGPAAESAAAKNTSIISLQQVRGHVQEQVQAASAELFQRVKALRTDGHQTKETLTKDLEATQKQLQSTTSELESIRDELKATKDVVNLLQKAVEELQQKTKQNVAAAVKTATLTARTGTKPSSSAGALTYSDSRFDGSNFTSSVTSTSNGTDVYENVCIQHDVNEELNSIRNVLRSSKGKSLVQPNYPKYKVNHWKWTTNSNPSEWATMSTNTTWIKEETLLIINMFENPGHCINDLGFATAMELLDNPQHGLQYERFIYFDDFRGVSTPNCDEGDPLNVNRTALMPGWSYCCQLMQALGAIRPESIVHTSPTETVTCFRKLVVPRLAQFRIPSAERELQAAQLMQQQMFDHQSAATAGSSSSSVALLNRDPWPSNDDASNKYVPTVFFNDRHGAKRRQLVDSEAIQERLQSLYHVNVELVRDWNKWTGNLPEQARIFNEQQYILQVHGGSNANIFFSRPGTKVYEIQCKVPPINKTIETKPSVDENNWKWFSSFAQNISLDYFQHLEHDGCLLDNGLLDKGYSPKFVKVDVPSLVESVAKHFQLQKKTKRDGKKTKQLR